MDEATIGKMIDDRVATIREEFNSKVDELQARVTELSDQVDAFQNRNEVNVVDPEVPQPDDAEVPEDDEDVDEDEGVHIEHH